MHRCVHALRAAFLAGSLACLLATARQAPAQAGPAGRPGPRHVILVIGDGMGFNHVEAATLYRHGRPNAEVYHSFPVRLAMSTYPGSTSGKPLQAGAPAGPTGYDAAATWASFDHCKSGATDSAAAATTMATGERTYNSAIGVDLYGRPITNASELAKQTGRSAGVISSVQISHATPAGFAAHNVNRGNYEQIADEMINRSRLDVIMGAGHPDFSETGDRVKHDKDSYQFVGGRATWENLRRGKAGADADGDGIADPWRLIETRADFVNLGSGPAPPRVCGIFRNRATLQQGRKGDAKAGPYAVPRLKDVPTLADMTRAAINVLDSNPRGFFLMVEAGAIDWAGHANQPGRLIEEQAELNEAVAAVVAWVERNSSWNETLLVITADHETGYLWGPGSGAPATWNALTGQGANVMPGMQFYSTGHTNSLVPFFAKGAGSHLFEEAAVGTDPRRGRYLTNSKLGEALKELLGR